MSYAKDLDEYTDGELTAELGARHVARIAGVCDYCKRPPTTPSCKFPVRHADKRIATPQPPPPQTIPAQAALGVALYAVVDTDNFGGDYPDERFVENTDTGVLKDVAERIAARYNGPEPKDGYHPPRFYKVVKLPYKLQPGFQP